MTFEQALLKLTELFPDKKLAYLIGVWKTSLYFPPRSFGSYATQDDIDFILAEIGWEYEVFHYMGLGGGVMWQPRFWRNDCLIIPETGPALNCSKLEASKQALISVVEKIIKEKHNETV